MVSIGMNLAQRTGPVAWTTIAAAIANLVLNLTLIPVWGIVGAGFPRLPQILNLGHSGLCNSPASVLSPLPAGSPVSHLACRVILRSCCEHSECGPQSATLAFYDHGCSSCFLFAGTIFAFRIVTASEVAMLARAIRYKADLPRLSSKTEIPGRPSLV